MIHIREITDYLETIAPLHLQEEYDNAGLIIGDREREIQSALVCLDVTPAIVAEAASKHCGLIIAHHPLIFHPIKRLTGESLVERAVVGAIRQDIAVYAIHTNLDNVLSNGVNSRIADRLGLQDLRVLRPHPSDDAGAHTGAGVIGSLKNPLPESEFLAHLKERMQLRVIRHTALTGRSVRDVAVCGGAGSFLLEDAIRAGAQVFVSADFRYHQFFDADDRIFIADIGHYESEQFTMLLLRDLLRQAFPAFSAVITELVTNPVRYYL